KADPSNTLAQQWTYMATIWEWMAGPAVFNKQIKQQMEALSELAKKDPGNSQLPFYLITRAKVRQARDLIAAGRREQADPIFVQVARMWDDLADSQSGNGSIQLRAFQVYSLLAEVDPDPDRQDHARKVREKA